MIGLIGRALTAPVTAPIRGVVWTAERLQEAAEEELYDEEAITAELSDLEARWQEGQVSDAAFEEREAALMDRLMEARARRAG